MASSKRKKDLNSIKESTSDDRLFLSREDKDQFEKNSRKAALALSSAAVRKGNDACGLLVALTAVFGEETILSGKLEQGNTECEP